MAQATETYGVGQVVHLWAEIDKDGTPVDPTGVICRLTLPDGTSTDLTCAAESTGVWFFDYTTVQTGGHKYRFIASGAYIGADIEREFRTE